MISVGDAIVAGVMNATSANSEASDEKSKSESSGFGKRKAPAGEVGNFIASRRKNNSKHE